MLIAIMAAFITLMIGVMGGYITFILIPKGLSDFPKFHNIKVISPDCSILPTQIYMDGKKLNGIRALDYHISMDEIPIVTFEAIASQLNVNADVKVKDMTVEYAAKTLRDAFVNERDLYDALVASIEGALRETTIVWEEWEYNETAKKVADRIIG